MSKKWLAFGDKLYVPAEEYFQELYKKIDSIIGGYYEFEGMCEWARDEDPSVKSGSFCIHENCHKAWGINMTQGRIRREIKELLL